MTALDLQLEQLATLINGLSRRSQAAFFLSFSKAYTESANWRLRDDGEMRNLLLLAQDAAYAFCLGDVSAERANALKSLDITLPSEMLAQSAWICADVALRVSVDATFESGMSVEYALEPFLGRVSEDLFGYWQVGSGDNEAAQVAEVMAHPVVLEGVAFCRWAIGVLASSAAPSAGLIEQVTARVAVPSR